MKTAGELGHTQFGTPLDEVLFADVDCDAMKWVIVPTQWGRLWTGSDEWASTLAPEVWEAHEIEPSPHELENTVIEFKSYADKYGGFHPDWPFEVVTYLYKPDPRVDAFFVKVWVDDQPDLTPEQAAGVGDPEAIDTPVVQEFSTEALGQGVKVTRHGLCDPDPGDLPGTQGIWVQTRYAFAVPNRQAVVMVVATEIDLARLVAASDDLDEFVRATTLHYAGGVPFVPS